MPGEKDIKVLIIDDSITVRELMKHQLEELNIKEVETAKSGSEACDIFDSFQPDLVFLDINMPEMNGVVVLSNLLEKNPDTYIVMLSSLGTKEKVKETQEIIYKDALVGAIEALDDIIPTIPATTSETDTKDLKSKEASIEDLVSEKILKYHEKFSIITVGFAQYEKIKNYFRLELVDVPDKLLKTMLNQLIELQMIVKLIKIGKFKFYLFNEISLSDTEKNFIKFAISKKRMNKEEFINGLRWDEEKTVLTIKRLQQKGILFLANHNVIIPGIIQEK